MDSNDTLAAARAAEFDKYRRAYQVTSYRMGSGRMRASQAALLALPGRGSYLDVGCGRGEMLTCAQAIGFDPVQGTEVIESLQGGSVVYGAAHALPFADKSTDVVTLFDVIEHLLPDDTGAVLAELNRVARRHVILTAANYSSQSLGQELHINRREYQEWDDIIQDAFDGDVTWLDRVDGCNSEAWRVDFT